MKLDKYIRLELQFYNFLKEEGYILKMIGFENGWVIAKTNNKTLEYLKKYFKVRMEKVVEYTIG